MINKKNKVFICITLCVLCLILILALRFWNITIPVSGLSGKMIDLADIVDVVAILSGISGILVGAASIRISNLGAVEEYFQQGDSKEYTEARRKIYIKIDQKQKIEQDYLDAAIVVSFFHFWGLMVKKKYLPAWVFDSASGYAVIRLYEGLSDMIIERRKKNPEYAQYFEWLYIKTKKKLKYTPVIEKDSHSYSSGDRVNSSFYSRKEIECFGFASVGKNVLISRKASIYSAPNIFIGDNVRVDDFCILSGNIKIGSNIHISAQSCLIAGEYGIDISDYVTISSRCALYAQSDYYGGETMTNPTIEYPYRKVYGGKIKLNKHCIVGTGSTILPGVILGEGTAVGAMSLVKNDTEPWKIYAGIPCVVKKERMKEPLRLEAEYERKKEGEKGNVII